MDAAEREQYLAILKQTPLQLPGMLKGVPKKLLLWTPAPGKWSILEIVCHLRDMERDAYLARYERILNEENPELKNIDGDVYALIRQYRRQKLSEALREWKQLRKQTLRLLSRLKEDQWLRPGVHETDGPLTVDRLLQRQAIGNDQAHLGQIEHIKTRYEILQKLEGGLRLVESALEDVSDEVLRRKPAPGKWSILEIVAHLAVAEQLFVTRYAMIADRDRPALPTADNNELAALLKFNEQNLDEALKEFKRLRRDTLTLLRALPQKGWRCTGLHPQRGEVTLEDLAKIHSTHDASHAARIQLLRKEFTG